MLNLNREQWILVATGIVLAAILATILARPLRINQDAGIYLLIGGLVLEGHTPYIDYFENNFPLVHYLHAVPMGIAQVLDLNPIPIFQIGLFLLTVAAIWLIYSLMSRSGEPEDGAMGAAVTLGLALATYSVLYRNHYGQREHLFILMFLPAFVLRWLRWNGKQPASTLLSVVLGIIAAVGASLKPHFLLAPLALEAFWIIRHRSLHALRAPETVSFVMSGIAYALYFLLIPRAQLESFIAMLRELQAGYVAYDAAGLRNMTLGQGFHIAMALAPFVMLNHTTPRKWHFMQSLGILSLAGFASFLLQAKGYDYHRIISGTVTVILVAVALFVDDPDRETEPPTLPVLRVSRAILAPILLVLFLLQMEFDMANLGGLNTYVRDALREAVLRTTQPGDRVLVITSEIPDYRPLIETQRRMAPGFVLANPLLFAYKDIEAGKHVYTANTPLPESVSNYFDLLDSQIEEYQPALIMVADNESCIGCPNFFSLARFLDGRGFISRTVLPRYQSVGTYDQVRLYQRVGSPGARMQGPVYFDRALSLIAWELEGNSTSVSQCGTLMLKTWWESDKYIESFYNFTAVLTDQGTGVVNTDGAPGGLETQGWQADQWRADARTLNIPCDLPPGEYPLLVAVYTVNIPAAGLVDATYEDGEVIGQHFYLTTITVTP